MKDYTPIMKQYIKIKNEHKDKILLFRIGDFYEMFFEDAEICSNLLMLNLTTRNKNQENYIPMCGFPHQTANHYIAKLMKYGKKVAICEQINKYKKDGLIERQVTTIWTPGTFVSESYLDKNENNYISCIYDLDETYGIASLDVATGYFFMNQFENINDLYNELDKINPIELLISDHTTNPILLNKKFFIQKFYKNDFNYKCSLNTIKKFISKDLYDTNKLLELKAGVIAASIVFNYVVKNQKNTFKHCSDIEIYNLLDLIFLDKNTRKNLEIFKNIIGDEKKSIFNIINATITIMGERLLKRWLNMPLKSSSIDLHNRVAAVSKLKKNGILINELKENLKNVSDLERIWYNISKNTAKPSELRKLVISLNEFKKIKLNIAIFKDDDLLKQIYDNIENFDNIINLITISIKNNSNNNIKEGNIIKDLFDKKIDALRLEITNTDKKITDYQTKERVRLNNNALKIELGKDGYYIEVSKKISAPADYKKIKELSNVIRYKTQELKDIEINFMIYSQELLIREIKIYNIICYKIRKNLRKIQKSTKFIVILDVLRSFAEISYKYNWCEQKFVDYSTIIIKDGKHPGVELLNLCNFIPNDTHIDKDNRIFIITGANMGGKSTYMRQVAIITLLCHVGSHAPASEVIIGGIDKIFTRLGSSDDITNSLSTFMVELEEISEILKKSTENSLILIDEIGRGTNYLEGKALALAILSEFIIKKKSFLLFSTHFYDLSYISKLYPHVKSIYFKAIYKNKKLIFLYKYIEGICNRGFALDVAKLANLPKHIIIMSKYYFYKFNLINIKKYKLDKNISKLKYLNKSLIKKLNLMKHIITKFEK